jgi:hypothetical protein
VRGEGIRSGEGRALFHQRRPSEIAHTGKRRCFPATTRHPIAQASRFESQFESLGEAVGPRPGEGAVGAFAFGRAKGLVEGTLATAGIPLTWITSPTWKRIVGIPPGKEGAKDAARSEAIRRWPDKAAWFARVKDHGRAEAALIGWAGLQREARNG